MDEDEYNGVTEPKNDEGEEKRPGELDPEHPTTFTFDDWALI